MPISQPASDMGFRGTFMINIINLAFFNQIALA